MKTQRPIRVGQTAAVEESSIRAFQIPHAPAAAGGKDFGVLPTDRAVIDAYLQRFQPSDPQPRGRIPDLVFAVTAGAAQTNGTHHANLLSQDRPSGGSSSRQGSNRALYRNYSSQLTVETATLG